MVSRSDYGLESVEAAKSVLVELTHLLAEYCDDIVLVGGWLPLLLLPEAEPAHVGSLDIDLALDHRSLDEVGYKSVRALLVERGYRQGKQPFMFLRDVEVRGEPITVEVDLLSGEYEGTGKGRRHQRVQDVLVRKVRGCDLAFEDATEVTIEASLPNGGDDTVSVRVASIVPFVVMKGMALHERLKEKDAYDIYFCVRNWPGGIAALIERFRPHMDNALVQEGLRHIAASFAFPTAVGPTFVASFEEMSEPEDRELLQRDVYERINEWLHGLGIET